MGKGFCFVDSQNSGGVGGHVEDTRRFEGLCVRIFWCNSSNESAGGGATSCCGCGGGIFWGEEDSVCGTSAVGFRIECRGKTGTERGILRGGRASLRSDKL